MFGDPAMTVAAIDRLVHHATIFELNVESYRRRADRSKEALGELGRGIVEVPPHRRRQIRIRACSGIYPPGHTPGAVFPEC